MEIYSKKSFVVIIGYSAFDQFIERTLPGVCILIPPICRGRTDLAWEVDLVSIGWT